VSARDRAEDQTAKEAAQSQLGFGFADPSQPKPAEPARPAATSRPRAQKDTLPAWARAAMPAQMEEVPEATPPERHVWRVAELVSDVRDHIERAYVDLLVRGEISNLRAAPSGHLYFTLKDGEAQLPAVMFRLQSQLLRFRPEDGLEILLRGRVSVYEQRGQMQLVADSLEPIGAGSLQIAFEQLKAKLDAEGLFAMDRKRPLPPFPHCVGIVTSPTGAVIQDFLNVAGRRHGALDVLLFPATVQGESAAAEIAAGIAYFNEARNVDVIVIARGGGSLEDLAPFNSEPVARAIAASTLPVVSAVGHETDFTIADFVADLRAPTPSAAAELITAAQHRIEEVVDILYQRLLRAVRYTCMQAQRQFASLAAASSLARVRDGLGRREQRVDELRFRMERAGPAALRMLRERLERAFAALQRQETTRRLAASRDTLASLDARMLRAVSAGTAMSAQRHAMAARALHALSPRAVLERGYALVFAANGKLLTTATDARTNDVLRVQLAEGTLLAGVLPEKKTEEA
jgi:exodeoxyribonuclease VII large subunit